MVKKLMIYLSLLLLISCNSYGEDNKLVTQNKKEKDADKHFTYQTINFLDSKYQKDGYLIEDNLTGNLNPSYSYFNEDLGGFTVDYIGKTKEEINFWNVSNKVGFFNNTHPEDEAQNSDRIVDILETRRANYHIFATFLDEKYIENISSDGEFDIKDNAEQKIFLYQGGGRWKLIKTVIISDDKYNDFNFYISLLEDNEIQ